VHQQYRKGQTLVYQRILGVDTASSADQRGTSSSFSLHMPSTGNWLPGHTLSLGLIGAPGAFAVADAEALNGPHR